VEGVAEGLHGQGTFLNPRQAKEVRGRPKGEDQVVEGKLVVVMAVAVRNRYAPASQVDGLYIAQEEINAPQ
jgi:hypothetical protein